MHYPFVRSVSAALLLFCAAAPLRSADATVGKILDPGTRKPTPDVAPASDEAAQAIARMRFPDGLKISLWAAEPMLANPVAFNFDEKGRIFIAETYRYRSSVLDIRDYMRILEDELANRNLDDFSAMINRRFDPDSVKELGVETEILRVVEDRDHDGVADHSAVYADGFNSILDGIASGVLARRGQVWFTNIPSLWKFTGAEKAETRTELSRGYGIRYNYTGHDLHGLAWGPDGKIYFSVGDRAAHAVAIDGSVADTPDAGAVFRSNPDGTQLEIYARGLRNPQSLAFTENGDLFTGDNDSDQGDEERLVQVVENGDSGWRIGYQYAPLGKAGPWNSEKLWQPRQENQPAYLLPPICNVEDGPSGIAYYPGTGLNSSYAGTFFVTHFTGGPARSGVFTYKVRANGATYAVADNAAFLTSALPTDVKFGPDGRLYITDWADGWRQSRRGRIYAISDPAHINDPIIKETQQLIGGDWTARSAGDLTALLGHPDWRVRLEAQYTLAERGAGSIPAFATVASLPNANPLARRHAIWGLGQLAEKFPAALTPLRPLLNDRDAEVRAQAAKMLGDHGAADMTAGLVAALKDDSNRVKFFAAQSLGKLKAANAVPALLEALRANDDKDNYLRHALVMGLVGSGNLPALDAAVGDRSRAVRLGVLLAYRRLGSPEVQRFLADTDPHVVREAVLAINDAPIVAGYPAVAALLDKSAKDEAVALRAINAHFRLGQPADATALAQFAARSNVPTALRTEALAQLGNWPAPPARDRIVGIFRPLAEKSRDAEIARNAIAGVLPSLLAASAPAEIKAATIAVVEKLQVRAAADALYAILRDEKQTAANRISSLNTLDAIKDARLTEAVSYAAASTEPKLRLAALPMVARIDPVRATSVLGTVIAKGEISEKKTAFDVLKDIDHPSADAILAGQLRLLAVGKVDPAAELELLEAAAKHTSPEIRELLDAREVVLANSKNPLAAYGPELNGGDRVRGIAIFQTQPVMACMRCHRTGADAGSEVGPNLADIGARASREQILESIVKPSAKLAPGFDASPTSAMPEIYATVLTKRELRDVVEYLASLRPAARGRGAGGAGGGAAPAAAAPAATATRGAGTPAFDPTGGRVLRALRKVPGATNSAK